MEPPMVSKIILTYYNLLESAIYKLVYLLELG
jgi:hypothetical protein